MKDWADRIIAAIYALIGAFFGAGAYMLLLGLSPRRGWIPFLLLTLAGGVAGWFAYGQRHREIEISVDGLDAAGNVLLYKRVGVVVSCLVGLYFLWDFASDAK